MMRDGTEMAKDLVDFKVLRTTLFLAGFLLPYVLLEPAPVDIVLAILPFLILVRTRKISRSALLIAFIYLLFSVLGITFSASFIDIRPEVLAPYVVVQVFLLISVVTMYEIFRRSEEMIFVFLRGYIVGAAISSLIVVVMHSSGIAPDIIYRDEFAVRVKGFFKDPNVLGPYLIFPIAALLFCASDLGLRKVWVASLLPISLLLVLTYSRAAMGGLVLSVCGAIFMNLILGFSLRKAVMVCLLFGGIIAVLFLKQDEIYAQYDKLDYLSSRLSLQGYDSHRLSDILSGLEMGIRFPLGIGPGIFGKMYDTSNPHNLFVGKLADVGIIPAIIMIWLLVYASFTSADSGLKRGNRVLIVLSGTLITHFVVSMVIYSHHWRHMLFLCIAAIALATHNKRSRRTETNGLEGENVVGSRDQIYFSRKIGGI